MKIRLIGLVLILHSFLADAQILKPAKWTYSLSKTEVKAGSTVELIFHVTIEDEWYLYSTDFDPKLDAPHTEFTFNPDPSYQLVGKLRAIGSKEKFDEIWGGNIKYFIKTAEFRQTIKVLNENPVLAGTIDGQVCSNTNGKCIRVDEEFNFTGLKVLPADVPVNIKKIPVKETPVKNILDTKEMEGQNDHRKNDPKENKTPYVYSARLTELENQKQALIKKDAQGKDKTIESLKAYLRKNKGKKK
jgi:thiol:disulfide interchange protein DsbD